MDVNGSGLSLGENKHYHMDMDTVIILFVIPVELIPHMYKLHHIFEAETTLHMDTHPHQIFPVQVIRLVVQSEALTY